MKWYFSLLIVVIVIDFIYIFAILPHMSKRPDVKEICTRYYAHRGLHDNNTNEPENSMPAFKKAIEAGYGIELDVQLTKDDLVVVFHDESLKRVCNKEGNVRDYTYIELQELTLLNSEEKIPLFSDVLKEVNGKIPLIVEIKIHENIELVCKNVNHELKDYKGPYVMESFHPLAVAWYKKNRPDILRGQLSSNFKKDKVEKYLPSYFFVEHLLLNFLAKPDFIAYCHKYPNATSFSICTKWFKAIPVAWTLKSQEELDQCKDAFQIYIFEGFIPK